ncbi:MAG: glycosyltransferase family 4 protein [Nitrospinae bacterium]|nr:glycosyltransferase family 4 protein [Nitrospinota bacterium]
MRRSRDKWAVLSLQYYCYPDEVGGAWKYTYEVNKRLVERGHEVFLIACKPSADLPDYELIDGIHHYRIGVEASKSFAGLRREAARLLTVLLERGPLDLVHVHNPLVEFALLSDPRVWRIPKFYHFHSLWYEEEKINLLSAEGAGKSGSLAFRAKLWARLNAIRLIEWACFYSARRVLFLSRYSERKFRKFARLKRSGLLVIPGGVDTAVFHPSAGGPEEAKRKLGLPDDRPILLTVRRLAARMGLENLVEAVAMIARRSPRLNFLLIVVGHGILEEKLKSLIADRGMRDRVRMIGRLPTETLSLYYQAADVFVLPTEFIEGFGLATAEALASGLPALGTPVGGTVEILQGLDAGLLFRDASPEAIADRIEAFLKDPAPVLALRRKCRETAVARYDWEQVVDRIEREFFNALA